MRLNEIVQGTRQARWYEVARKDMQPCEEITDGATDEEAIDGSARPEATSTSVPAAR